MISEKWVQETSRGWTIKVGKIWGSGSEFGGVRVWRVGPLFRHNIELTLEQQIFMIFMVEYFFKKEFSKIVIFN